jgi:hypothetical protein
MHHITFTTVTSLHFLTLTFWNYYVLKLLRLETISFSDAMLSDINVVLCYILSQYPIDYSVRTASKIVFVCWTSW